MRKCKHCQSEIDNNAIVCPNCRKSQRTPNWVIALICLVPALFVFIAVLNIDDLEDTNSDNVTEQTQEKKDEKEKTKIIQERFTLEDGHTGSADEFNMGYYIEGYIRNNTKRKYSYVQVTFNLYDSEGNQLGTAIANINNLEANGRWKFKAIGLNEVENIASYKLAKITGY